MPFNSWHSKDDESESHMTSKMGVRKGGGERNPVTASERGGDWGNGG